MWTDITTFDSQFERQNRSLSYTKRTTSDAHHQSRAIRQQEKARHRISQGRYA
jgi:hypothetical protein